MGYLLAQDAINGKAGKGFMVVDGQNIELFGMKKFESSAEVQTDEFSVVGSVVDQTKVKGLKYSGTATVYYGTPAFLKILMEYKRTGRFPLINFQITNDDKGSSLGSQVIGIYGLKFQLRCWMILHPIYRQRFHLILQILSRFSISKMLRHS